MAQEDCGSCVWVTCMIEMIDQHAMDMKGLYISSGSCVSQWPRPMQESECARPHSRCHGQVARTQNPMSFIKSVPSAFHVPNHCVQVFAKQGIMPRLFFCFVSIMFSCIRWLSLLLFCYYILSSSRNRCCNIKYLLATNYYSLLKKP